MRIELANQSVSGFAELGPFDDLSFHGLRGNLRRNRRERRHKRRTRNIFLLKKVDLRLFLRHEVAERTCRNHFHLILLFSGLLFFEKVGTRKRRAHCLDAGIIFLLFIFFLPLNRHFLVDVLFFRLKRMPQRLDGFLVALGMILNVRITRKQ